MGQKKGWLAGDGHRAGVKAAERVIDFCLEQSIPYLSLYTFSIENFKRPAQERNFLFNVLIKELKKDFVINLKKKNVRILFIGDRSLFPESVKSECYEIEKMTAQGTALQVNLLFCYGGQQEIVDGVKKVAGKVAAGTLKAEEVTHADLEECLWTAGTPAPEMIVRTGGVKRLSNFLLFQAAYSEFFFLDCMWPELTGQQLKGLVETFSTTQRNFGT